MQGLVHSLGMVWPINQAYRHAKRAHADLENGVFLEQFPGARPPRVRHRQSDRLKVVVAETGVERHHYSAVWEDIRRRVGVRAVYIVGLPLVGDMQVSNCPGSL